MRSREFIIENLSKPVICVDVQPTYSMWSHGLFSKIINFVNNQTGPVLMFVNAEEDGQTRDTVKSIKQYWEDIVRGHEWYPEDDDSTYDNPVNWNRFTIDDKGYGWIRSYMDIDVEPRLIIKLIRYMYQKRVNDARELVFPSFGKRTADETELYHLVTEFNEEPFIINWTSVAQLKRFDGAYIVGGARLECLREVELLMNAFNIKYKRIDSLVY